MREIFHRLLAQTALQGRDVAVWTIGTSGDRMDRWLGRCRDHDVRNARTNGDGCGHRWASVRTQFCSGTRRGATAVVFGSNGRGIASRAGDSPGLPRGLGVGSSGADGLHHILARHLRFLARDNISGDANAFGRGLIFLDKGAATSRDNGARGMNGRGGRSDSNHRGSDSRDGGRGNGGDGLLGLGTAAVAPTSLRDVRAVAGGGAGFVLAIPNQPRRTRVAGDAVFVADEETLSMAVRLWFVSHLLPGRLQLLIADALVTFVQFAVDATMLTLQEMVGHANHGRLRGHLLRGHLDSRSCRSALINLSLILLILGSLVMPLVDPGRAGSGHLGRADLLSFVKDQAFVAVLHDSRERAVLQVQGANDKILGVAVVADNIHHGPVLAWNTDGWPWIIDARHEGASPDPVEAITRVAFLHFGGAIYASAGISQWHGDQIFGTRHLGASPVAAGAGASVAADFLRTTVYAGFSGRVQISTPEVEIGAA